MNGRGRSSVNSSARITGGSGRFPPTAVVDSHAIHGVEISALSVPRYRPSLLCAFFLVRPLVAVPGACTGRDEYC